MTSSNPTTNSNNGVGVIATKTDEMQELPIVVAGAGPCGLVAALTLQKENIPFVIVERACRDKLCSNVGSGFDLAPTTIDILRNRLQLEINENFFHQYGGMYMCDMDGLPVRQAKMKDVSPDYEARAANRAEMQNCFLNALLLGNNKSKQQQQPEEEILKCGVSVTGYQQQDNDDDYVTVQLSDGNSIKAKALLACDGIHSAVRKTMMATALGKEDDEMHFCNIHCWWGKMDYDPSNTSSAFAKSFEVTQEYSRADGSSFVWALGDRQRSGGFMGAPNGNTFMWAYFIKSKHLPPQSDDLTRRGGMVLDEKLKMELSDHVANCGDLIRQCIQETPATNITLVGLYDRQNLQLPYVDQGGRVALLGDAAHPQTPFMGQGVNQAITDAYVCCMRLAQASKQQQQSSTNNDDNNKNNDNVIAAALKAYDSSARKKGVNGVIRKARSYGNTSVSKNRFVCWLFKFIAAKMPLSWLWTDFIEADKPNMDFVTKLDRDLGLETAKS